MSGEGEHSPVGGDGSGAPSGRPARILRDSQGWFTEGTRLKAEARRARRCVECRRALDSGRSAYCGRRCQWAFRGRYFWDAARTYVIHRDRFTCQSCHRRLRVAHLEVDHVVEIAQGGPSLDYLNLQTLCRGCHRAKTVAFLRNRGLAGRVRPAPPRWGDDSRGPEWGAAWFPS
jgi:5-methylcytosine-specific restriction endonuclease McrA